MLVLRTVSETVGINMVDIVQGTEHDGPVVKSAACRLAECRGSHTVISGIVHHRLVGFGDLGDSRFCRKPDIPVVIVGG